MTDITLKQGERGFACGGSGSGKSVASGWLLYHSPAPVPYVIYDTKVSETLQAMFPQAERFNSVAAFRERTEKEWPEDLRCVLVSPSPEELSEPIESLDTDLYRLYSMRMPMTVYLDEAQDFHRANSTAAGRGLMALISRGREQGVTFLATTQRPAMITPSLMSEARHYYVFNLQMERDRKKIEEWLPAEIGRLPDHHFLHIDSRGKSDYFRPVKLTVSKALRDRLRNGDRKQ